MALMLGRTASEREGCTEGAVAGAATVLTLWRLAGKDVAP
jgi:hypothetical protein